MRSIKTFNTLAELQAWFNSKTLTTPILALDKETDGIHLLTSEGPVPPGPTPDEGNVIRFKNGDTSADLKRILDTLPELNMDPNDPSSFSNLKNIVITTDYDVVENNGLYLLMVTRTPQSLGNIEVYEGLTSLSFTLGWEDKSISDIMKIDGNKYTIKTVREVYGDNVEIPEFMLDIPFIYALANDPDVKSIIPIVLDVNSQSFTHIPSKEYDSTTDIHVVIGSQYEGHAGYARFPMVEQTIEFI